MSCYERVEADGPLSFNHIDMHACNHHFVVYLGPPHLGRHRHCHDIATHRASAISSDPVRAFEQYRPMRVPSTTQTPHAWDRDEDARMLVARTLVPWARV